MELKNVSQNKLFFTYGTLGLLLYIIVGGLSTIFECKKENIFKIDIDNYICKVKYTKNNNTNNTNYTYYNFESFTLYFENFKNYDKYWELLVIIILGIIALNLNKYFLTLTVKYLSPVHFIFSTSVKYFIQKIIMVIYTLFD